MFREHLAHLIDKTDDIMVAGEADNIRDGLELIKHTRPSIALIDITLKGASGLELIKELRAKGITTPVLVLSMHEESLYAERAVRAGANGYITKHEASADVMAAIRHVLGGGIYFNARFMSQMMSKMMGTADPSGDPVERLADRELEVFRLIGRGLTNREIGEQLALGTTTVDRRRGKTWSCPRRNGKFCARWHRTSASVPKFTSSGDLPKKGGAASV